MVRGILADNHLMFNMSFSTTMCDYRKDRLVEKRPPLRKRWPFNGIKKKILFFISVSVTAHKLIYSTGSVYQFGFTCVERM